MEGEQSVAWGMVQEAKKVPEAQEKLNFYESAVEKAAKEILPLFVDPYVKNGPGMVCPNCYSKATQDNWTEYHYYIIGVVHWEPEKRTADIHPTSAGFCAECADLMLFTLMFPVFRVANLVLHKHDRKMAWVGLEDEILCKWLRPQNYLTLLYLWEGTDHATYQRLLQRSQRANP